MSRRARTKKARAALRVSLVRVDVERVDVIRGHDGALRGAPELVFVCAVYDVARLVARGLLRVGAPWPYPSKVVPAVPEIARARDVPAGERGALVVVFIAIEEDRGTDVQTLYDALADPARWALWPQDAVDPSPVAIVEGGGVLAAEPRPVNLLLDDRDLRDLCREDEFVAATAAKIDGGLDRAKRLDWIARFVSADEKNCWSADVQVRVR